MSKSICQVCETAEAASVCASSIGPVSFAFCPECLMVYAEPQSMFEYLYEEVGTGVSDFVKTLSTYIDGEYITWNEFVKLQ